MVKKIKRYKMKNIKGSKKQLAFVKDPAIKVKGIYFSEGKEINIQFSLQDDMMVVGPAMIPDLDIIKEMDKELCSMVGDREYIKEFVYEFINQQEGGKFNFNHKGKLVNALLVNSLILDTEEDVKYIKAKWGYDLPIGSWWIEAKVEDVEFWETVVKEGKYHSFSIETLADLVPMGEYEIKMSVDEMLSQLVDEVFKDL